MKTSVTHEKRAERERGAARDFWQRWSLTFHRLRNRTKATRKKGVAIAAVALCAIAAGVFSQHVHAYNLLGATWSNEPTSGCCGDFYVQINSFGYGANQDACYLGYASWSNYNGIPVNANWYTYPTSPASAQDTDNGNATWDGITFWDNPGGFFSYANLYLNTFYTFNYGQGRIQSVCAHEIGHQLGLGDVSGGACVLMNGVTSTRYGTCGVYTPQTDDINGVNAQY